jgi:hypothetical protein
MDTSPFFVLGFPERTNRGGSTKQVLREAENAKLFSLLLGSIVSAPLLVQ